MTKQTENPLVAPVNEPQGRKKKRLAKLMDRLLVFTLAESARGKPLTQKSVAKHFRVSRRDAQGALDYLMSTGHLQEAKTNTGREAFILRPPVRKVVRTEEAPPGERPGWYQTLECGHWVHVSPRGIPQQQYLCGRCQEAMKKAAVEGRL